VTLSVRDAATSHNMVQAALRQADGLHQVERLSVRTATGLLEAYRRAIRVAVNPVSAYGYAPKKSGTAVYTNSVAVSVDGGTPPYHYAWTVAPSQYLAATTPTSASTVFQTGTNNGQKNVVGTAVCAISDASGLTSSVTVPVQIVKGY
jgi:hypothetical protein